MPPPMGTVQHQSANGQRAENLDSARFKRQIAAGAWKKVTLGRALLVGHAPLWRCSFATDSQPGAVIGDEDGEQARGLGRAGVLTDQMRAARRLEEGLAGPVDFRRSGSGVLGADFARQHIGEHAAGMVVLHRLGTRRIVDHDRRDALAWNIGQFLARDLPRAHVVHAEIVERRASDHIS